MNRRNSIKVKTKQIISDYRIDYSNNCIHCSNYDYQSDDCDLQDEEHPILTYPSCKQFKQRSDDYCSSCGKPYNEKEDEVITEPDGYEEFWGSRVARPDAVVGFVCNECGEFNNL